MKILPRICYIVSLPSMFPLLVLAADCDNLILSLTVTQADHNSIKQQCVGKDATCISSASQKTLQVKQAAALHRFLGQCLEPEHPNYLLAQSQLLQLMKPGNADVRATPLATTTTSASATQATNAVSGKSDDSGNPGTPQVAPDKPQTAKIKLQSDKPWLSSLSVGNQYLPDYSKGETSHLSRAQAFAEVIVDYRNQAAGTPYARNHWGTFLQLEGMPVARKDATKTSDLKFNDVAQSLTAGVYTLHRLTNVPFLPSHTGRITNNELYDTYTSEWFVGGKLSIRQREKIGEGQDGIDPIAEVGLQYRYNEFKGDLAGGNVMPRGSLSFGIGYWDSYEDAFNVSGTAADVMEPFGDLTSSRWRYLIRGEYRLADTVPFYLGFKGNLGKGPDTLGLYLSLRLNAEQFIGIFTESVPKSAQPSATDK